MKIYRLDITFFILVVNNAITTLAEMLLVILHKDNLLLVHEYELKRISFMRNGYQNLWIMVTNSMYYLNNK